LYRERKLFESEYWSQVGNDYTRHEALAKRLKEKINRIDTEYYRFIYTLAEFAVKGDSESLAACRAASGAGAEAVSVSAVGEAAWGQREL
jgi:hypothetical protein